MDVSNGTLPTQQCPQCKEHKVKVLYFTPSSKICQECRRIKSKEWARKNTGKPIGEGRFAYGKKYEIK
jgi:hypothetical protein